MDKIRVALIFKDFAAWLRSSCVGLHVAGYATAEVLREHGIEVVVFPVRNNIDAVIAIDNYNETHDMPLTHVIISAPWLSVWDATMLVENYPGTQFVILSHSNVGFLQADPWGVELLRQYQYIAATHPNLKVGGNSERFARWMKRAYGGEVVLLPNLYPMAGCLQAKRWNGERLKVGAFGAVRPFKNFMTAAGAALVLQQSYNVPVEFHMSSGGESEPTVAAIEQMFADVDGITLVRHPWAYWDDFVELVGKMDLLIQVSYTESFNMITADGIAMGVPSVVSPAITWAPDCWKADPDDAVAVAEIGKRLLDYRLLANAGREALLKHNKKSLDCWIDYLRGPQQLGWLKRLFE
jgi:hypothetical protein